VDKPEFPEARVLKNKHTGFIDMQMNVSLLEKFLFYSQHGGTWSKWPFGPGFTGGWLVAISKFAFIGLVLALILFLLRWLFGPGGKMRSPELDENSDRQGIEIESALEILQKRLARGEISEQEFQDKKRLIRND